MLSPGTAVVSTSNECNLHARAQALASLSVAVLIEHRSDRSATSIACIMGSDAIIPRTFVPKKSFAVSFGATSIHILGGAYRYQVQ